MSEPRPITLIPTPALGRALERAVDAFSKSPYTKEDEFQALNLLNAAVQSALQVAADE